MFYDNWWLTQLQYTSFKKWTYYQRSEHVRPFCLSSCEIHHNPVAASLSHQQQTNQEMTKCLQCDPEQCQYWKNKNENCYRYVRNENLGWKAFYVKLWELELLSSTPLFLWPSPKNSHWLVWLYGTGVKGNVANLIHLDPETWSTAQENLYTSFLEGTGVSFKYSITNLPLITLNYIILFSTFPHIQEIWWPIKIMVRFR